MKKGFYFSNTPGAMLPPERGGTLILVERETHQSGDFNNPGWEVTDRWQGHPKTVTDAKTRPALYFPGGKSLRTIEQGLIWEAIVTYGNIDLHSVWTITSNMNEPRISVARKGILLDQARPGWTRAIETIADLHFQSNYDQMFDYDSVIMKPGGSFQTIGGTGPYKDAYVYPTTGHTLLELNLWAKEYARAWIFGQESYLEPQWVVRNIVTVSNTFNWQSYNKLFRNVGKILTPEMMQFEKLLTNEVIPPGTIIPGVPYWFKNTFTKDQTTKNQFIITREWWGIHYYNTFAYELAS